MLTDKYKSMTKVSTRFYFVFFACISGLDIGAALKAYTESDPTEEPCRQTVLGSVLMQIQNCFLKDFLHFLKNSIFSRTPSIEISLCYIRAKRFMEGCIPNISSSCLSPNKESQTIDTICLALFSFLCLRHHLSSILKILHLHCYI